MEDIQNVMEYVCDYLCKYAATRGKSQKWLDEVCERCRLEQMITEVRNGGNVTC